MNDLGMASPRIIYTMCCIDLFPLLCYNNLGGDELEMARKV